MKFRLVKENFLTPEECQSLIDYSENVGYAEALIRTRDRGEVMNKDVRDNDRVIWDSEEMAVDFFEKVKDLVQSMIDGYEAIGLNERFRFYRYKDGQRFRPHVDGAFKRSDIEVSLLTLLLYLNEGFEGGATTLITLNENIIVIMKMIMKD